MEGKKEKKEFVGLLARNNVITDTATWRCQLGLRSRSWRTGVRWFKGCAARRLK